MWSSVVSHNFLFVVVGWVLFVTFSSDTSKRGRGSCLRNTGMETFDAFKGSKIGFLFVTIINNSLKKRQRMALINKTYWSYYMSELKSSYS